MFGIQVINQPNGKRAIFDPEKNIFLAEDLSEEELVCHLADLSKPLIRTWLAQKPKQMDYLECIVLAGRVKCCDCPSPVSKESFNPSWPMAKQRCSKCRG